MNLLNNIENIIFNSPRWKLLLILFLIMIFKTGIFYHPNLWRHLEVARSPFENFFENSVHLHYYYQNWFGSFVAGFLGAKTKVLFFLFHLFFSFAFVLLFIKFLFKNLSEQTARISIIIFFLLPVSGTVFYFVGYDSVTLFLIALGLYFHRNILILLLIGTALGMQHFELAFVGIAFLLFALLIDKLAGNKEDFSIIFPLVLIIGVVLGKILLILIFNYHDIVLQASRADWYHKSLPQILYTFFFRFYNIIWFSIGLGWIVIIKYYYSNSKKFTFFISFLGLLFLLPILPDTTRTFSVLSFLLIAVFLLTNEKFLTSISKKESSIIMLLWALIPYGWVWEGVARQSHFSYTVAYILKHFVNWFDIETIEASRVWPFFHSF